MDEYERAKLRFASAAEAFRDAEAALEAAETEFNAAIVALDALEGRPLPTAADVRGIFRT